MNTGPWEHADRRPSAALDVVAGLVPGASAARVARAAVREAAARGGRVRFLQVLSPGGSREDIDSGEASTFAAALRALREVAGLPVSFEVAVGEPGPVLVQRSHGAGLLVIGGDDPDTLHRLEGFCLANAHCEVVTAQAGEPVA